VQCLTFAAPVGILAVTTAAAVSLTYAAATSATVTSAAAFAAAPLQVRWNTKLKPQVKQTHLMAWSQQELRRLCLSVRAASHPDRARRGNTRGTYWTVRKAVMCRQRRRGGAGGSDCSDV
jgi:hypothetical protein